jgi:predicted DNA-binding transcriptional regulator YafY
VVYDALMRDRQFKLSYKKRDAKGAVIYESVHPLAIIQRGPLIYLVCLFAVYDDVRTLAMHRVQSAEMLYLAGRKKADFSIDHYIESGNLGVRSGDPIELKVVFARRAGEHLYETALAKNQRLVELDDGRLELTATVPNTKELQWWLLGMGDGVEVLAPAALRDQIKGIVDRMSSIYSELAGFGKTLAQQM